MIACFYATTKRMTWIAVPVVQFKLHSNLIIRFYTQWVKLYKSNSLKNNLNGRENLAIRVLFLNVNQTTHRHRVQWTLRWGWRGKRKEEAPGLDSGHPIMLKTKTRDRSIRYYLSSRIVQQPQDTILMVSAHLSQRVATKERNHLCIETTGMGSGLCKYY